MYCSIRHAHSLESNLTSRESSRLCRGVTRSGSPNMASTVCASSSRRQPLFGITSSSRNSITVRSAIDWALHSKTKDGMLLAGGLVGRYRALWLIPGRFKECGHLIELTLKQIDEERQPQLVVELLTGLLPTLAGTEREAATDRLIAATRVTGDRLRLAGLLASVALEYSCSSSSGDSIRRAQDAIDEAWNIFVEEEAFGTSSVRAMKRPVQRCSYEGTD